MIRESRERYVSDCGCRVTALPLYSEQLAFAEKRLRRRTQTKTGICYSRTIVMSTGALTASLPSNGGGGSKQG